MENKKLRLVKQAGDFLKTKREQKNKHRYV